jgi:hypothetical protein
MNLNAKEITDLNRAKDRVRTFWNAACVEANVPVDSKFVVFDFGPAAKAYGEAMHDLMKLRARIRKNVARREKHQAMLDLGLKAYRVNGETIYE